MSGSINQGPTIAATPVPVPSVVPDAPAEVGHGETVQIGTITNSPFDPLSIQFVGTPPAGTLSLDANGDVLYTAPTNVTAGQADSFTYELEDSLGGLSAPITSTITLDPGPAALDPNLVVGRSGSIDLSTLVSQLATPGLSGDTLTVTAASAQNGTIIQTKAGDLVYQPIANGTGSPTTSGYDLNGSVTGGSGPGKAAFGSDVVTYTVTDQLGDTVTGTADITVDPGPNITAGTTLVVQAGHTADLTKDIANLISPGLAGDTDTVTTASTQSGSVIVTDGTGGGYDVKYTAPASGNDTLTFQVQDQNGDTSTGSVAIVTDPGPILAPGTVTIGHGQTDNLTQYIDSLITPGTAGDTDTITSVQAEFGQAALTQYVLTGENGTGAGKSEVNVSYTAPAGGNDVLNYTVTDQNGISSTGTVAVTVDPGPQLAAGSVVVGQGQSVNLTSYVKSLITPGLPNDVDRITTATTQTGSVILSQGDPAAGGSLFNLAYTAPASGSDTLSYTVVDGAGDTATGTVAITVDPGPILAPGTYTIGHGQSANLTSYLNSLITPGAAGDTETITGVTAQSGTASYASFVYSKGGPEQVSVGYTAPAQGNDVLNYTVADQRGDTASGSVAITVDPGPTAGNVSADIVVGGSIDLTQQILGADQPGLKGDTLTLSADNTQGTLGNVSLVNGDLVYTASSSAFAQLGGGASTSDSFTYTVADQYGDQATGTVTLDVSNPTTTVNGGPYGGSTIQGPAGNATINAFGYNNTIDANGGNDTINAGLGQATVNAGGGNVVVNLDGYNNLVTGGDGIDSVSGSQGNTSVSLGNGNDTINLGGNGNAITVGNGNDTIVAGAGNDTVVGGSGSDSVTLAGYSNSVTLNGGTDTITGGAGNETFDLTGGSASLALSGNSDMVFLHSTNATIDDAGQGSVINVAGGGTDVIQGAASDSSLLVDLTGGLGGYTSATSVLASLTSDGNGGALLSFGASHGSIDFVGVAPSALHAANFKVG